MRDHREIYELRIDGQITADFWVGVARPDSDTIMWTYFNEKGRDFTGWKQVDGNWYYFGGMGILHGWHRLDQEYYYFDPVTGIMKTSGTEMRDGLTYEFSQDGKSVAIDGLKTAEAGGSEGWIQENGSWYYLRNGQKVVNEWLYNGDNKYYVGADGVMYTGWRQVDGALYYFGSEGKVTRDGIMYGDEHKYAIGSDGRATELEITRKEKMIYSHTTEWCYDTYIIYTLSQERIEELARVQGINLTPVKELLRRDWGITSKEEGYAMIQSLTEAGKATSSQSQKAWNFSRAMMLCEMMRGIGWIDIEEQINCQLAIAPLIQSSFTSWSEYNDAYMEGFRAWNTNPGTGEQREAAYQSVKNKESYYCNVDWNRELKRTW